MAAIKEKYFTMGTTMAGSLAKTERHTGSHLRSETETGIWICCGLWICLLCKSKRANSKWARPSEIIKIFSLSVCSAINILIILSNGIQRDFELVKGGINCI